MINSTLDDITLYSGSGGLAISDNYVTNYEAVAPAAYTNTIHVDADVTIEFADGYKIKGSDLSVCVKLLHKLAREEYPEEFL